MIARLLASAAPPLTPDPDEARRWAEQELSDPVYQAAEPTLLDRFARSVLEFLGNLLDPSAPSGWGPSVWVVIAVILVAAVVVGILIWGRPRTIGRAEPGVVPLFDIDDGRTADDLRRDAEAAAAREDWDDAIVLRFRATARGLLERGLVETHPGATVRVFARQTGRALPALAGSVDAAAEVFDDIRYLRRPGSAERYRVVAALDETAQRLRVTVPDATAATP